MWILGQPSLLLSLRETSIIHYHGLCVWFWSTGILWVLLELGGLLALLVFHTATHDGRLRWRVGWIAQGRWYRMQRDTAAGLAPALVGEERVLILFAGCRLGAKFKGIISDNILPCFKSYNCSPTDESPGGLPNSSRKWAFNDLFWLITEAWRHCLN